MNRRAPTNGLNLKAPLLALLLVPFTAFAQGLGAEGAVDTIVGSEVTTGEESVSEDESRIIAAIEKTAANVGEVRKTFSLDAVEIIFLADLDSDADIGAKIDAFEPRIVELRQAIEGSAMFYHAVNSHRILLRDIVALEFDDSKGVTIFVSGRQP